MARDTARVSYENVAVVRSANEALAAGDVTRALECLDPAVEWHGTVGGIDEGRVAHGREEVVQAFLEYFETWERIELRADAYVDAGGDEVVVFHHEVARGRASGVVVETDTGTVNTVRGGKIVRVRGYLDRELALEAAGLAGPDAVAAAGATAYAERGLDGVAETWHPDVVYEEDPLWPGASTFRGRANVRERFREYEEQLGVGEVKVEALVERGGRWVMIWRHAGTTPGAGVAFEHRWAWVVELRDGLAGHIRAYFNPDEALEAAER